MNQKNIWKALVILIAGLILTTSAALYTKHSVQTEENEKFKLICSDLKEKINTRLKAHAQLLRSGAAFFVASDSVTRTEWAKFNASEKINKNLPGIQGVGYAIIIPKNLLSEHIQTIKNEGFPDYDVTPVGDRTIYTSIVYLEPLSDRNLRAFGFDMFSEQVRRKAMEIARDSDFAMLTGKVTLIQETSNDVQAGTLMYVPVYKNGMPVNNVLARREAIKGWVFCPYRMTDLMNQILGSRNLPDKNRIHLQIYDEDTISSDALLFDSQANEQFENSRKTNLYLKIPYEFNRKKWTLQFTQYNNQLSFFQRDIILVFVTGISISLMVFVLILTLMNTRNREQQILLLYKQLEKLNIDKDRFISILAHDLKSPFNIILGFLGLLSTNIRKYSIEKIEMQINMINNSSKNLYNLLDEILLWARNQSGKLTFEPQELVFTQICSEVVENLKLLSEAKNISINCSSDKGLDVFADKNMLKTILRNLISNAIKFTNNEGKIDVLAEPSGKEVIISVSDNGVGIEPEKLTNLFDFSQINSAPGTANEKGTGIGLLICKDFIEKHNGKIWVESEIGKGSVFIFSLPVNT